jgi:protein-S-isoprenylcysteine O-methyltransferase Ste14
MTENPMRFIIPPVVLLAVGALMWAVDSVLSVARVDLPLGPPMAVMLVIFSIGLMIAAVTELVRVGTTVNPMRPERSTVLVTERVFGRTRNPIYVADLLLLLALALWLGNIVTAPMPLLFFLWIDRFQIPAEEAALRKRFGADFERYCDNVRRWF